LLATTVVLGLAGPSRAEGPLVLAGGKLEGRRIFDEILKLGGSAPRVAIITAASRDEVKNGREYEKDFVGYGASRADWVDLAASEAPSLLRRADVIFFGGGDQSRLLARLKDRPAVLEAVRQAHTRGAVIAGTSAGTAVMTRFPMITGDASWNSSGGLGLFPYGLLDTHFSQRRREGRLTRMARATRTPLAFGIDENTALVVEHGRMRAVGANQVLMYTGAGRGERVILTGAPRPVPRP
jgi:cyanophycinase